MNMHAYNPEPTGSQPVPSSLGPPTEEPAPTLPQAASADGECTRLHHDAANPWANGARTIGKYTILEEVQVGGMGVVYKVRDTELDRIIALKMIKGGLLATAEEAARFRREAQAAAQLDHPNIVPVYEIGQESGCLYFTMAFAWGGSLTQQRNRFVADRRAAVMLVEKVARAIHAAHQRGILHRDLKPANILLNEQGDPWVSDFGLAKFLGASLELTQTGQVLGTPSYMAPEQAAGQTDQISASTDVWALGVILYELLTGQRPFKGESQEEQLRRVRMVEPLPPRTVNRTLDRSLETVILRCLEKEPARRYASAEALADDLARWLRGEPVLARPLSWPLRAWRIVHRQRRLALRLGLAAVLMALLWLVWKSGSPSVAPEDKEDAEQRKTMAEQLARLQKGEKVILLGESGPPLASRWQPRRLGGRTMLGLDKVFRVYAEKRSHRMLELLSSAPKRYRLRAQVQHCDGPGEVGIYFAHGKRRADESVTHCFFKLNFDDQPRIPKAPSQPLSQACLALAVCRENGEDFLGEGHRGYAGYRKFVPAGKRETMPWRSLEVEVTPERIKPFWEGEVIPSLEMGPDGKAKRVDGCNPRKFLEQAASAWGRGSNPRLLDQPLRPHIIDAELTLGEGLGLYILGGTAAFRSVEIEPSS